MTVTFPRQWQVRLNVAGWWGAWVSVEAEDTDRAFEAACDQYVLDGYTCLTHCIDSSEILETSTCYFGTKETTP